MPKPSALTLFAALLALLFPLAAAAENPANYNYIGPSHLGPQPPGTLYYGESRLTDGCKMPPLKKRMSYRVARAEILAAGYKPAVSAAKKAEGRKYAGSPCFYKDQPEAMAECKAYPELEECAADGPCATRFRDAAGDRLKVVTFGAYDLHKSEVAAWDIRCSDDDG